jgi:hypothetical protein
MHQAAIAILEILPNAVDVVGPRNHLLIGFIVGVSSCGNLTTNRALVSLFVTG